MSRTIKFRVWSEDQKTYGYKFPYNSIGDFYVNTRGKVFSDFGNTVAPEVRQEAFIVEQYTGLKDKNGKEIYEGDIVKTKAGDILQVNSLTHSGWFASGIKSHNEIQLWLLTIDDCIEIIGNIHENPELIGGGE